MEGPIKRRLHGLIAAAAVMAAAHPRPDYGPSQPEPGDYHKKHPSDPELAARVQAKAQARRERRNGRRFHDAYIAPLLKRQARALDNFRFTEAEELEGQIQQLRRQ